MESSKIILKIRNLSKSIGEHNVLSNINLDIIKSSSVSILGHSGCGKSVLIKCICGLLKPDQGSSVIFRGEDIAFKPLLERYNFNKNFGLVFQGNALFDSMPVWKNIGFSMLNKKTDEQIIEAVKEKLKIVGLNEDAAYKMPDDLSGGMQKRVALARALMTNPKILFLDEPTSGLDPITARTIADLICSVKETFKMTVLSITHDPHYMNIVSDYVAFLHQGKVDWYGKKEDVGDSGKEFLKGFIAQ